MKKEQFTVEAAILWGAIPAEAKERILKNVYCPECFGPAEMVKFRGQVKKGDVILTGKCAKCGHKVVRILETSEHRVQDN